MKNKILILGLLVVVVALGYFVWSKEVVAPVVDLPVDNADSTLLTYTDQKFGFSFQYPKEMIKGEGKVFLSSSAEEAVPAVTFTRVAHVVHQSMSGESQPTTNNPKISVAVLQGPIADIAKDFSVYDKIGENIFQAGVEGEGVIYYLVALNNKQTLLFEQSFIDESFNIVYQDQPGFLTLPEQKKLTTDLIATLQVK